MAGYPGAWDDDDDYEVPRAVARSTASRLGTPGRSAGRGLRPPGTIWGRLFWALPGV